MYPGNNGERALRALRRTSFMYIGIRPRDATYDKTYWDDNIMEAQKLMGQNFIRPPVGVWL